MRHLEHVGAQRYPGIDQVELSAQLDVPRQQHAAPRGGGPQHDRAVVDRGPVVGVQHGRGVARPDHVDDQPRPPEPLSGPDLHQRDMFGLRLAGDLAQGPARLGHRADRDPGHRPAP